MKFGLFGGALAGAASASDSQNYKRFIDYVCEADAQGFHSVFVVEHHFTGMGQVSSTLNLLAYLAGVTERIRLGSGVAVLPWHNPVLLAEQIATLDLLSGGRADIGVGKGYRPTEFQGFAIDPSEAPQRYEETLDFLVKALSATERFSHEGPHWRFDDIIVEPQSVQRPHPPIWVGAGSEGSIRATAARGFNLLLDHWATPPVVAQRIATYADAISAAGCAYRPDKVGVARAVQVVTDLEEYGRAIDLRVRFLLGSGLLEGPSLGVQNPAGLSREDLAREIAEAGALVGRPDEIIAKLQRLSAVGVDYVLLTDAGSSVEALRTFAREVMPAFG